MNVRTYQLYATASANAAASVRIVASGIIHLVQWAMRVDDIVDGSVAIAELSLQNVIQSSNDAQGVISAVHETVNMLTSGLSMFGINHAVPGLWIPVEMGQFIYLNTSYTATSIACRCMFNVLTR